MELLAEKIYQDCITNYPITLRKFQWVKNTPKDLYYLFLPLTRDETIKAWEEGIKRYVNNLEILPKQE